MAKIPRSESAHSRLCIRCGQAPGQRPVSNDRKDGWICFACQDAQIAEQTGRAFDRGRCWFCQAPTLFNPCRDWEAAVLGRDMTVCDSHWVGVALAARSRLTADRGSGRPLKVTSETASDCRERIRAAFRLYKERYKTEPSQPQLVEEYADEIGYTSKRGFEDHLRELRRFNYFWPDSFR